MSLKINIDQIVKPKETALKVDADFINESIKYFCKSIGQSGSVKIETGKTNGGTVVYLIRHFREKGWDVTSLHYASGGFLRIQYPEFA